MKIRKLNKSEQDIYFPSAGRPMSNENMSDKTDHIRRLMIGGKRNRDIQLIYPVGGAYLDSLRVKFRAMGYDIPKRNKNGK